MNGAICPFPMLKIVNISCRVMCNVSFLLVETCSLSFTYYIRVFLIANGRSHKLIPLAVSMFKLGDNTCLNFTGI